MKSLGFLLRMLISIIAIAVIVYFLRGKISQAIVLLQSGVSWTWFWTGVIIYLLAMCFFALRLQLVFKIQNITINFKEASYLNFIGIFFNLIFPSAVGGDVAKAYYAYRHNGNKIASTTAVILDRLMGFAALMLMSGLAIHQFKDAVHDPRIDRTILILSIGFILTVIFFMNKKLARFVGSFFNWILSPKWKSRISELYHAIHEFKNHKAMLLYLIFISIVGQAMIIFTYYAVGQSLSAGMSLWIYFVLVPIVFIVSMAPSLGGLGVRDAGIVYLYSKFMPSEKALAITLLLNLIIYGLSILCGILFAFKGEIKPIALKEMGDLQ